MFRGQHRRRTAALLAVALLIAGACGGGSGSSSGGQSRTLLVDFGHDEFAGAWLGYFPRNVTLRPGDTLDFRQIWNGEPHSVTMGTLVDQAVPAVLDLLAKYPHGEGAPPEVEQQFEDLFSKLPSMLGEGADTTVNQVAAQPCFIDSGSPPEDGSKPCPKRAQPAFNGRQAYYSSGFIPYAGNAGNKFTMKLADDLKPGTYNFYCNLHGPDMSGKLHVVAKGSKIPSQTDVSREARKEVDKDAIPLLKAFRTTSSGTFDILKGARAAGFIGPNDELPPEAAGMYFAGYGVVSAERTFLNEFIPKTIKTKVGDKVTWAFVGSHTVSFGVPEYFPLLTIDADGTVKLDKRGIDPAGGPGIPDPLPDNPPNPLVIDGGKWGGTGFHSSGLPNDTGSADQIVGYSLTFTKAGTYDYACLIHPKMVGKVVVEA